MLGFVALSVVCVATATGYVLHSRARVRSLAQPPLRCRPSGIDTAAGNRTAGQK